MPGTKEDAQAGGAIDERLCSPADSPTRACAVQRESAVQRARNCSGIIIRKSGRIVQVINLPGSGAEDVVVDHFRQPGQVNGCRCDSAHVDDIYGEPPQTMRRSTCG